MFHVWWCSTTLSFWTSGILEQPVSGTIERTRWTCSFPWFKSLRFLFGGEFRLYYLCHRSNEVLGLQQWIQNGFEIIRTTPGIFQLVRRSLFRRATSCVEAPGRHVEHFLLIVRRPLTRIPCFRRPMFIKHFLLVLWCRFTFCMSGRAFLVQPLQIPSLSISRQLKGLHPSVALIKLPVLKLESNPATFYEIRHRAENWPII
jgi:hypothetical protein